MLDWLATLMTLQTTLLSPPNCRVLLMYIIEHSPQKNLSIGYGQPLKQTWTKPEAAQQTLFLHSIIDYLTE